jgi:hypothetical protein
MTTSLESLTLNELEERYNAMSRYLIEMKEEINRRKSISKDNSEKKDDSFIFNLLTSMTDTISSPKSDAKKLKKKIKVKKLLIKEKKPSKEEPDTSKRKIKATADDMKETLRKDNIKFKTSILRDELEELIRNHNLVRVSEKISKERKIKK